MFVEFILTVVWWIIREFRLRIGKWDNFLTLWTFKAGKSSSRFRFCKVNWRSCDVPIDCGAHRFFWKRNVWWDDSVCIEEASQHANTFPKTSEFQGGICSEKRPIRTRKTNCVQDFVSISVHLERMNSWRTLRLDHKKFTEWRRPRFRRLMGLSSVIRVWHAFRSDSRRFCTSQNLKILFSF